VVLTWAPGAGPGEVTAHVVKSMGELADEATIAWGDGTPPTRVEHDMATHAYAEAGPHEITLTAKLDTNDTPVSASAIVYVREGAPPPE
jgi:PKD repeat protein